MESCCFCDKAFLLCHNSKSRYFLMDCPYSDWEELDCPLFNLRSDIMDKRSSTLSKQDSPDNIDWTEGKIHFLEVFHGRSKCIDFCHTRREYIANVYNIDYKFHASLKVFFCDNCQKWYISDKLVPNEKLALGYRGLVRFSSYDYSQHTDKYDSWDPQSILTKYGYSARENGLNAFQRQQILKNIIESGILSTYQIISHLSGLIDLHQFEDKWQNAIGKYEADIQYINTHDFTDTKRTNDKFVLP